MTWSENHRCFRHSSAAASSYHTGAPADKQPPLVTTDKHDALYDFGAADLHAQILRRIAGVTADK